MIRSLRIYFRRAIVPCATAAAAGQLAAATSPAWMPEIGAGEVGDLQRAFNVVASSLGRVDELRQLAGRAALRRATLVAPGGKGPSTF